VPKSAKPASNSRDDLSRDSSTLDPILTGRLPDLTELPHNRLALVASAATARLGHVFPRWIRRNVDEDWGVNGPRAMLLVVVTKHGGLTMSQASRILDVTPRAITGLVDGLEAEGFLRRETDSNDKRVVHILPTERAVEKANRLLPQHEARFAELFDVFNTDELRTYIGLLSKLANRIKSELHAQEQAEDKE
jgi:DNA-binding MarR family transcriptional regulator